MPQHVDTHNMSTTVHDLSVLSGTGPSATNQSYNQALILNQRGQNNMSQIVPTSTSAGVAGGGQSSGSHKYKNANALLSFGTQPAQSTT